MSILNDEYLKMICFFNNLKKVKIRVFKEKINMINFYLCGSVKSMNYK